MLHRDYILQLVDRFVKVLMPALDQIEETGSSTAIGEMESAVSELVELDPSMLLSLAPESVVTFVSLSPNAGAVAPYMVWGLMRAVDAYGRMGDASTAELRREQAQAIADAFGLPLDVIPDEIAEALGDGAGEGDQASEDGADEVDLTLDGGVDEV